MTPDLSPAAAAERQQQATVDPAVIAAILNKTDDDGSAFNALVEAARAQLGAGQFSVTGDTSEEFVVNAAAPIVANELAALIDHASEQIKYWSAQKDAAKDVLKEAALGEIKRRFGDDVAPENIPGKVTIKANNVPIATWNQAADSRQLDTEFIKQKFPDVEKNHLYWKTVPGTRRFLIK